jgi:GNAT superfamily N-acetyltransferase
MHRVRLLARENALHNPALITESDYLMALNALGRGWVIEEDGEIVAFAIGYRSGSIWALFVHPGHEDRGYGTALHAVAVDWLWSLGHKRLWLGTGPGTRAERFYLSKGWGACSADKVGDIRPELVRLPR